MSWQQFHARCLAEERARARNGPSPNDRAWQFGPFQVTTIFGRDGATAYKTDLQIGQFAIHVFWRGDEDPDPHDHQMNFWTFPLVSYLEQVRRADGSFHGNVVRAFWPHFRPAEYAHRLICRFDGKPMEPGYYGGSAFKPPRLDRHRRPIVTAVWRGRKRREWGFWGRDGWTPWRDYIDRARSRARAS